MILRLHIYPLLFPKRPSTSRTLLDDFCVEHGIVMDSNLEIASYALIEELVKIGLGVGLVTKEFVEREIDDNNLFFVNTKPELPSLDYSLFTLKDSYHSFAANKLIEIITKKRNK